MQKINKLDDKEIAIKNLRDYAANKIISGDTEYEMELSSGSQGIKEFNTILRKNGYSKICVLGDRINFNHGSPMEDTLVKNRSGKYAVASLEQNWEKPVKMHLWIVDVEPIREYAEILDSDNLGESLEIKKESNMKINENSKITLTLGQLKKLVRESTEWNTRWSAIDGHPDGGETEDYFSGTCDRCEEYFDDENSLSTLYGWFMNDRSIRRDKDEWKRIDSLTAKMDDDTYDEFVDDFDGDYNDYCEYCAIDKLEELAKKYVD